jgi:8-hydroxy-5-deazaflavin:NADPH oxidoreductase
VKIFNSTGAGNMADPHYGGDRATMLYCGDDAEAKKVAAQLAADLGFEPVDAGALSAAYLLEHAAMLWIHLAYGAGLGRNIAFKLMKR